MNRFTDLIPAWAKQFKYQHHSPSDCAKPHSLALFDKCIARPRNLKSRVGVSAIGGKCAETYAKNVLIEGMTTSEAFAHSLAQLDEHQPLPWLESDATKLSYIRDDEYTSDVSGQIASNFELTMNHTLEGLREAVEGCSSVVDMDRGAKHSRPVSVRLTGLELDFLGYMDVLADDCVVEIKTKWLSLSNDKKNKRGWSINSLPPRPEKDHVNQVALYWHWMRKKHDRVPVRLVYANNKNFRIFRSEDTDELQPAQLEQALERLRTVACLREEVLKTAEDLPHLLRMVPLELGHRFWRYNDPEYIAVAEGQWEQAINE